MPNTAMPRNVQYTILIAGAAVGLVAVIHLAGYAYTFYTYYSAARAQVAYEQAYEQCQKERLPSARAELQASMLMSCMDRVLK